MKLEKPFYRLPLRFDVERLRAEVAALPAAAWARHPHDFEGNTAARLITVAGTQNDAVGGEMAPTPALLSSPYLQQVLASFGTVLSRSRLMRIEGGGAVPQHSDVNYHWFYRVRIHVPIVTRREVRFHCGDTQVHMGAGEAWIFDNWRQHRVENPVPDARIHLVADTTGTSSFWRLVGQAQADGFERPAPNLKLIPFDPAAKPRLLIERFNVPPVMPPAEVEQLAFDLLGDLAPADDRPESAAALQQFVTTVVDFCRDWRSLWSLFGDLPQARPEYERLLAYAREQVNGLPPVVVASVGMTAQFVMRARILEHVLGPVAGREREAPEFNLGPGPARSPAPPPQAGFTAAMLEQEPPPARRPSAAFGEAGPGVDDNWPELERPLIVVSAPRAGSTLVFETLAQAAGLYTIGGESHALIESIDALRPAGGRVTSNRLTAADATPEIVAELRRRFAAGLKDRSGAAAPRGEKVRLLEKTPKNALRVPFLLEVFPDALFVFLHRDPRANLSSIMEAWRSGGWITYRGLPGWEGDWSLLLPPGYESLAGRPLEEVAAFQWEAANRTLLDDLAGLPATRWITVRYEDFVARPRMEVERLLGFAGLGMDPGLLDYVSRPLPESRYTQTAPAPDKWRRNEEAINRILPGLSATVRRLGR